ncbi:sensor histidine kinase [Marinobacterium marinum]|uniref:histidine kinase n=1 Tax=Marinobacterium marinum TaxID=2756129 RepID=A0A7W2ABB2_9GAMM|nr:sensor histidine kinase [Marinobacterium marinum]MBA4501312.1 sensor histidine kinase N-terminal domain-containing protein [Marinobacterium marinum]
MSLRNRLLLLLGCSFLLLWLSVAVLMYWHLSRQVGEALDQRLAASADMVAGLVAQQPGGLLLEAPSRLQLSPDHEGVACQVRTLSGAVVRETVGASVALPEDPPPGFSTRELEGERWRLYSRIWNRHMIVTADRMVEREALERSIMLVMVVPFALALTGSLLVLWWGVRRGLRPLQNLSSELRRREPGMLEPLRLGPVPAELSPVLATLNRLLARVSDTLKREQRFASQAAHEFRTPLTGIKTHLQVARRVDGEAQQRALAQAEQGVVRLQDVSEQLLLLARLELNPQDECTPGVSVQQVVEGAMCDLSGRGRIDVRLECSADTEIAMPDTLAVIALRNLLENALKYSDRLEPVALHVSSREGRVYLTVSDRGNRQVEEGDWTPAPRQPDSHGLGLAIVESILACCRGRLIGVANAVGGLDQRLDLPEQPAGRD